MANYWDQINPLVGLDFKPYNLPNEVVLGALKARTDYFIQGAQRVQNAYESAMHMNLSNDTNKEQFQQQMNQATGKLKEQSLADLSIGENVTNAMNIFKPIVTNSNFLKDEYATNNFQKTFSSAQNDVNKNGKTSYNAAYVNYNKLMQERWRKADPSTVDQYISDPYIGQYSPLTQTKNDFLKNVEKELTQTIISQKKDPANPGYLVYNEKSFINEDALRKHLLSTAPPEVKQQMDLEARNELLMRQNYQPDNEIQDYYKKSADYLSNSAIIRNNNIIAKINVDRALEKDPEKLKNYNDTIDYYNKLNSNIKDEYSKIDYGAFGKNGDLNKGFEQASSLYFETKMGQLANGMARTIKEVEKQSQDAAYWSMKNYELKKEALLLKARGQQPINPGEFVHPSAQIEGPSTDKEKADEMFNMLQHSTEAQQLVALRNELLGNTGLGLVVNDKGKNLNILEYIEKAENSTENVSTLKSKMSEDKYRQLIGLLGNAYVNNMGDQSEFEADKQTFYTKMSLRDAANRLKHVFSSAEIMDKAIKYTGLEKNDLEKAANLYFALQLEKSKVNGIADRYVPIYKKNLSDIINTNDLTSNELFNYNNKDVLAKALNFSSVEKEIKRQLTPDEKKGIAEYVSTGNAAFLPKFGQSRMLVVGSPGGMSQSPDYYGVGSNAIEKLRDNFKSKESLIKAGIEKEGFTGINAPSREFGMFTDTGKIPKDQEGMVMRPTGFRALMNGATIQNPVTGELSSSGAGKELIDQIANNDIAGAKLISSVKVFRPTNGQPYAVVKFNMGDKDVEKQIKHLDNHGFFGTGLKDVNEKGVKIYLNEETLERQNIFPRKGNGFDELLEAPRNVIMPDGGRMNVSNIGQEGHPDFKLSITPRAGGKGILIPDAEVINGVRTGRWRLAEVEPFTYNGKNDAGGLAKLRTLVPVDEEGFMRSPFDVMKFINAQNYAGKELLDIIEKNNLSNLKDKDGWYNNSTLPSEIRGNIQNYLSIFNKQGNSNLTVTYK